MNAVNESLQRLRQGNARFISGHIERDVRHDTARHEQLLVLVRTRSHSWSVVPTPACRWR